MPSSPRGRYGHPGLASALDLSRIGAEGFISAPLLVASGERSRGGDKRGEWLEGATLAGLSAPARQ